MRASFRALIPKLFLLIFGLLVAVVAVEVLARVSGLRKDAGLEPQGYYQPHPEAGYVISDNFPTFTQAFEGTKIDYWSNEIGCFDAPLGDDAKNPFALLVGDSFTWGFTPFDQKWGTTIQQVVGQRILKCGVNGYGTKQEVQRATDVLARTQAKPKVMLVGYFYNDLAGDYLSPSVVAYEGRLVGKKSIADIQTGAIKEYSSEELAARESNFGKYCKTFEPVHPWVMRGVCLLKKHSVMYPYLKETGKKLMALVLGQDFYHGLVVEANPFENQTEFLSFVPESTYSWLPQAWRDHLASFDALHTIAQDHDMELVVVLIPYKAQVYPALADDAKAKVANLDLDYARTRVTDHLTQMGVRYVDLTGPFQEYARRHDDARFGTEHDLYWTYDGHWNPRGNQLAGYLVAQSLFAQGLVPTDAAISDRITEGLKRLE